MPQFRLTIKLAKDLKIELQEQPVEVVPIYDDWYVDLMRANRKKVVVFMHINTFMALAMPCTEIGGIKNMFECFPILLRDFLYDLEFEDIAEQSYNYFDVSQESYTFTKTKNLTVLRFMTDFKYNLEYDMSRYGVSQIVCDKVSKHWLKWLLRPKGMKEYTRPMELMQKVFSGQGCFAGDIICADSAGK